MVFATRKRIYASAFAQRANGGFKRRKFIRRRRTARRTGGRRTLDYTSLNTRGHSVGFRGRKTTRRAYKNHIWNSTIFKDHWRSFLTTTDTTLTTPAALNTGTIQEYNMYNFGTGAFWTTGGGAVEKDLGLGVPDFADVTLRGGKFELVLANTSANDIKFKIWRFTTGNNPDLSLIPNDLTPTDQAWDPSVVPDFYSQVGKPYMAKEVTVEGGNSYTFVTRFKSQKIDQNAYDILQQSRSPFILVLASNVGNATANSYSVKRGYNLSFAGDAVSPAP